MNGKSTHIRGPVMTVQTLFWIWDDGDSGFRLRDKMHTKSFIRIVFDFMVRIQKPNQFEMKSNSSHT